ncbi:hypothetical protein OG870_17515 [Streptomyces sp. NBC_00461]|uniref:hypothetical protein n=1 Tax=Streptomyces sp. NBC_00461 TaxID=2975750 RepID=UPI002E18AD61
MFGEQAYCTDCIRDLFLPFDLIDDDPTVEQVLDFVARERGINRYDENSFSAYQFPKPIGPEEQLDSERCGLCHRKL